MDSTTSRPSAIAVIWPTTCSRSGQTVFGTLLRIGKYLESASSNATSARYTGKQIKSGA